MCSMHLVSASNRVHRLADLSEGERGTIVEVHPANGSRVDRLLALGVTPGASVKVLQTFPGFVFLCDQTELAVERAVANAIIVRVIESGVAGDPPERVS